jgi:hypothetical protein
MLKTLFLGVVLFLALPLALVALVLLPLLLIGGLVKLLIALIVLPFRLLGAAIGAVAGLLALLAKGFVLLFAILLGVGLFAGGALAFVLIPLGLLVLVAWAVLKLLIPGAALAA